MAEGKYLDKDTRCYIHEEECLNLYCYDCDDIICIQCLLQKHQKHELKSLLDAKPIITDRLRKYFASEKEKKVSTIDNIKQQLFQELTTLENDGNQIETEIEKTADKWKSEIDKKKSDLMFDLKARISEYKQFLKIRVETLTKCESQLTPSIGNESVVGDQELNTSVENEVFATLKHCEGIRNEIQIKRKSLMPRFVPVEKEICQIQLGSIETYYKDVDDGFENTSDELREDIPCKITLPSSQKSISKIIPLSDEMAFVISDNKLFKLIGSNFENSDYSESVDDIALLKDGSLLLLMREKGSYIKRLLKTRVHNFVHSDELIPQCICTNNENFIFIILNNGPGETKSKVLVQLDIFGIRQKCLNIDYDKYSFPMSVVVSKSRSDLYILYSDAYFSPPYTRIKKVESWTKQQDCEFKGAVGIQNVSKFFKCHGICVEHNGKLLVTDQLHHSVLMVNENLQFEKCVLSADDGLESPGALALHGNLLWVADGTSIWKFSDN